MYPALFLDRDGVIIDNIPSYVQSWDDVKILPGALAALARARISPYKILLITNQSAVGRGILALDLAWEINQRLVETITSSGGRIDGTYMCPHAPEDDCPCRKPKPGLLLQAARELSLNIPQSILIGDALSDLLAGQAAGLHRTILVRTGRGREQEKLPYPPQLNPFEVYDSLADALQFINLHSKI